MVGWCNLDHQLRTNQCALVCIVWMLGLFVGRHLGSSILLASLNTIPVLTVMPTSDPDRQQEEGSQNSVQPYICIVEPWELAPCKCEVKGRFIQVPGEERPRCFECLEPVDETSAKPP